MSYPGGWHTSGGFTQAFLFGLAAFLSFLAGAPLFISYCGLLKQKRKKLGHISHFKRIRLNFVFWQVTIVWEDVHYDSTWPGAGVFCFL